MSFYDIDEYLTAIYVSLLTALIAASVRSTAAPGLVKIVTVLAWPAATTPYFFLGTLDHWLLLPFFVAWFVPLVFVVFYEVPMTAKACFAGSIPLMIWLLANYFGYESAR